MPTKTTSIRVDVEIWKEIKMHCVKNDLDIGEYMVGLAKKDLRLK